MVSTFHPPAIRQSPFATSGARVNATTLVDTGFQLPEDDLRSFLDSQSASSGKSSSSSNRGERAAKRSRGDGKDKVKDDSNSSVDIKFEATRRVDT